MNNLLNIHIKLMEKFLKYLSTLSEDDISGIIENKVEIQFRTIRKEIKNNKKSLAADLLILETIIYNLQNKKNREEGIEYLSNTVTHRKDLENLLKELDIPFQKKDNIEKLKNKVIEATIGFRLRSQAIQGTTPK